MEDKHQTMHDLPAEDRPYEKLLAKGAGALTDAELLAVIIRSGSRKESALALSQRLIQHHGPLRDHVSTTQRSQTAGKTAAAGRQSAKGSTSADLDVTHVNRIAEPADQSENQPGEGLDFLRECSLEELMAFPGIGQVKAVQLHAAVELGSRLSRSLRIRHRLQIRSPLDAIALLEPDMVELPREELRLILLDIRNRIIRISRISEGGLSAAIIAPRDLFREAVRANAAAMILAHNHPSGEASPSNDDLATTRKLIDMGEMMGIKVVDHLILAKSGSISMKQNGLV